MRIRSHPLSRQIVESMPETPVESVDGFVEIPGKGIAGTISGRFVRLGSEAFILSKKDGKKGVFAEIDGEAYGYFDIKSYYREGLPEVLTHFRQQNAGATLLSGDNDREQDALAAYIKEPGALLFNQSPQNKLDFVKNLQQQEKKVLMLGDGLNDAGALRQSDVGIVVAENTNNFTPACDAILHAEEFHRLPQFLNLAQWGITTVNRAYLLAACYNVVGLSYAVSGTLSPVVAAILMPLSSVTIVLFGFGMSHWKAWRLKLL